MKGVVLMVLGSLLGVTACRPTVAKDFVLVGADGVAATVVIPENADESTKLAGTELTNYVAKITGVILEVKKVGVESRCRCRTDAPSVFIGTLASLGDAVPAAIAKRLNATDNPEAGCVATDGKTLWIVGKEDVSELYATYHFLEDKLGVRWFKAATKDDPGEYVPTSATILLKPFAEMREPRFRIRRLDKASAFWNAVGPNSERCAVRNGYQVYPAYNIRGKKPTYGQKGRSPLYTSRWRATSCTSARRDTRSGRRR